MRRSGPGLGSRSPKVEAKGEELVTGIPAIEYIAKVSTGRSCASRHFSLTPTQRTPLSPYPYHGQGFLTTIAFFRAQMVRDQWIKVSSVGLSYGPLLGVDGSGLIMQRPTSSRLTHPAHKSWLCHKSWLVVRSPQRYLSSPPFTLRPIHPIHPSTRLWTASTPSPWSAEQNPNPVSFPHRLLQVLHDHFGWFDHYTTTYLMGAGNHLGPHHSRASRSVQSDRKLHEKDQRSPFRPRVLASTKAQYPDSSPASLQRPARALPYP